MNPYIERYLDLLRDPNAKLSHDQRMKIATIFGMCDDMLRQRTEALQRIGHIVGALAGTDLVTELPEIIADIMSGRIHDEG